MEFMIFLLSAGLLLLVNRAHVLARPQEGYNYEPPENPLVIARPTEAPEAASDQAAEPQSDDSHGGGHGHHGGSGDPLDWLRESIPGEPEVDYPIFAQAPESAFTCEGKDDGMYADVEARCQVWHQCFRDQSWAFLCPNGTIFNQEIFTCVWWFDFDCSTAESFYGLNADLYAGPSGSDNNGDAPAPSGGAPADYDQAADYNNAPAPPAPDYYYDEQPALDIRSEAPPLPPAAPTPAQFTPEILEPAILDPVVPAAPVEESFPDPALDYVPEQPDLSYDDPDYVDEYGEIPPDQAAPETKLVEEEPEVGYNYPVPENPLELPEKKPTSDDSVAPLALYGAPAQPFEAPETVPESLPTAAPAAEEELPLAQYLPPPGSGSRGGRRLGNRRGRRRGGQRRKRLIRTAIRRLL